MVIRSYRIHSLEMFLNLLEYKKCEYAEVFFPPSFVTCLHR